MDLIKEAYNILAHHLGEETPRGKRFPKEHEELRSDITRLISYAFVLGKHNGREEMRQEFRQEKKKFDEYLDKQCRGFIEEVRARKPESREAKRDDDE